MNWKQGTICVGAMVAWIACVPVAMGQHAHTRHGAEPSVKERQFQAGISAPDDIAPGRRFAATIHIQDDEGKAVADFDIFQEKLMHLILVRDDLSFFSHLHPTYQGNGRFLMEAILPLPGAYTLFCDYQPAGAKEQISVLNLRVKGMLPSAVRPDAGVTRKVIGDVQVGIAFSPETVKANRDTVVVFDLKRAVNGRPVEGLRPYLGEKGHLVIIRESMPLSARDYIHAHATKEGGGSQIRFVTRFPDAGLYTLWCQFDMGGHVHTADFRVRVE